MPDATEISKIWEAIKSLEFRVNSHTHTGTDLTSKLKQPDSETSYAGFVESDGTAGSPMPEGWTTTRVTTGEYRITHNLGTTEYAIVATPHVSYYRPAIFSKGINDVTVIFESAVLTTANTDFDFILLKP